MKTSRRRTPLSPLERMRNTVPLGLQAGWKGALVHYSQRKEWRSDCAGIASLLFVKHLFMGIENSRLWDEPRFVMGTWLGSGYGEDPGRC
ncbi:hypothetical protein Ddc_11274 [Ditylenchus destructor]|nr:hypothetical protein Ddc_11274 [Ditylenchus destructor]